MWILFSLSLFFAANAAVFEDGQKIPFDNLDEVGKSAIEASAMILSQSKDGIVQNEDGSWTIPMVKIKDKKGGSIPLNLCPAEKYAEDYRADQGRATATLIGAQVVLASGHSFDNAKDCSSKKIVFGIKGSVGEGTKLLLPNSHVYSCKRVLWIRYDGNEETRPEDYATRDDAGLIDSALILLDRPVEGIRPLPYRRSSAAEPVGEGSEILFVSSLMGKPISGERARVVQIHPTGALGIKSDSSVGSSGGSYVSSSGMLEAIHIASSSGPGVWDTTTLDIDHACKRWIMVDPDLADFKGKIKSEARGVMLPIYSVGMPVHLILHELDRYSQITESPAEDASSYLRGRD